jgi:hypothetical protein
MFVLWIALRFFLTIFSFSFPSPHFSYISFLPHLCNIFLLVKYITFTLPLLLLPVARCRAVGWGTMLEAGRSPVPFPTRSLDFSIDLILPAALWPWGGLSL